MNRFARQTSVTIERSQEELRRLLRDYGGDDIFMGSSESQAAALVQFRYHGIPMQFRLRTPAMSEERFHFTRDKRGFKRQFSNEQTRRLWDQACRQQWRVVILIVRANLEAVESGTLKPEEAFLPYLLLPNGRNVADNLGGGVSKWIAGGNTPRMLMETFGSSMEADK